MNGDLLNIIYGFFNSLLGGLEQVPFRNMVYYVYNSLGSVDFYQSIITLSGATGIANISGVVMSLVAFFITWIIVVILIILLFKLFKWIFTLIFKLFRLN